MTRKVSRILALALIAIMLTATLPMAFAVGEELPTITILMSKDGLVEDYETNAYTKWLEESCGCNIDFVLIENDFSAKLALMVNGGDKLPDVINASLDLITTQDYADAGAIIPINDLIEEYGVNFKGCAELYKNIYSDLTCPDGNIYGVPHYIVETHDQHRIKAWINQDWLTRLNLEIPTTTDELYTVLKAFKEQDANGNGDPNDEIPWAGSTSAQGTSFTWLTNAFVYNDTRQDFFVDENGKISAAYNTEAYKEALLFFRKLVDEGLYDVASFSQGDNELKNMLNAETTPIIGMFSSSSISRIPVANPLAYQYVGVGPITGPEGVCWATYEPTYPVGKWFITADCENPELAYKLGDLQINPDESSYMRTRYGVEGENWVRVDSSKYESNYPGNDATWDEIYNIWSLSQNNHWRKQSPTFSLVSSQQSAKNEDGPSWYNARVGALTMQYVAKEPSVDQLVILLKFTADEAASISEIQSTINSYVNENAVLFVTREISIEDGWDKYLADLDEIGLPFYLETCQTVFDRQKAE